MNRRLIVIAIAIAAVAALALGTVFYPRMAGSPGTLSGGAAEALVRPDAPMLGPETAPVTMVEFFDPACEACRIFHPLVKRGLRRYDGEVRLVLRYAAFHGISEPAIRILEAARRQDKFLPVLDILFDQQPRWAGHEAPDIEVAWQLAKQAGLDLAKAREDAQLPEVGAIIRRDALDIETLGVRQTPTIYFNGVPLESYTLDGFNNQLREAVEAATAN